MSNTVGTDSRACEQDNYSTLIDLLARRVAENPDGVAYTFLGESGHPQRELTYSQLERKARAIGALLQNATGDGDRILLVYPAGLDFVAAFLGCLLAGRVAVPVYPPKLNRSALRLELVARDARPSVALTTKQSLDRIQSRQARSPLTESARWVATDTIDEQMSNAWRRPDVGRQSVAFLQYTSGSTANPKGVVVTHGNLIHNSRMLADAFGYDRDSLVVSWLPVYHDMGLIGGALQPLYGGFPGVMMSPFSFLRRPAVWLEAITRYGATISGGPNFAYDLCARRVSEEEKSRLDLSTWAVAFNGSEPVQFETMRRFSEAFEGCGFRASSFYPCYGLAEATLIVSGGEAGKPPVVRNLSRAALGRHRVSVPAVGESDSRAVVSCGRALADQKVVTIDTDSLEVTPGGTIGEIWVSGESVAQGYWNRPDESKKTFGARPADDGQRAFGGRTFMRTGDLGFIDQDGNLFVTGRLKDLIIIRGINHYPQDIELTTECSHQSVRSGAAAAFAIEAEGESRVGIICEIGSREQRGHQGVDQGGSAEVIAAIRRAVFEEHELQLSGVSLVRPGAIPRTSSGKIQRSVCAAAFRDGTLQALCEWRAEALDGSAPLEPAPRPDSPEEITSWLALRIASRIGCDPAEIAGDQPIAAIGLDSIAAIELVHSIEEQLGASLSVTTLFEATSLEELSAEVFARMNTPGSAAQLVRLDGSNLEYPLSKGQQALWFLQQLDPADVTYVIPVGIRIRGNLDVPRLRKAFEGLIQRHPALRTTFVARQGTPAQVVHARVVLDFREIDASEWPEERLKAAIEEDGFRQFDLEKGPMFRTSLYRRSVREHVLLVSIHHIIADFWSLSLLLQDLGDLYSSPDGTPPAWSQPAADYADYVRGQEEMLAGEEGARLRRFWREQLQGELPPIDIPADRPRPPAQTHCGASYSFELDRDLTHRIKQVAASHSATLYTILLASFQALLHKHTGQRQIVVGSLSAARTRASTSRTVGYFVNPIVQRANLAGDPRFSELLDRVRAQVVASLEHQDYPFPVLVEQLQPARDPSRSPLFQVMFILQRDHLFSDNALSMFAIGQEGGRLEISDLVLESMAMNQRAAQFDVTLVMAEANEGLRGSFQYNADLFEPRTIERLAARFVHLLEAVADDADARISSLESLTDDERRQLLVEWNATRTAYDQSVCVHQLFERRVERTPDAIAVVFEDRSLSYLELDRRANRLASRLKALGVGPDVTVGLVVERSMDMLVGILAILKSGGAYVPLDLAFPSERLGFMIEDSGCRVLVTQKRLKSRVPPNDAKVVYVDQEFESPESAVADQQSGPSPENLCYVIYTSGSTGKPKGVMVTHASVVNFFAGMAQKIGCGGDDAVLAVTSMSFDISVLELLWTLINGCRVVVVSEHAVWGGSRKPRRLASDRRMDFSLFYFASADSQLGDDKYRLLLEGARFADEKGFTAVWTPERHFHAFGGLYPNPALASAALAVTTRQIQIRAGSVVMPLHNPIRVAEEWSFVDNLSRGRVGIAFASGWHANDFVFFPENYAERKQLMLDGIRQVQQLWRGEAIEARGGAGNAIEIRIHPKPVQPQLPIWLTAAGALETFIKAGELGANVLTHLLGQSLEDVAARIRLYRQSLKEHGHDPRAGRVTLMLHTFIGEDRDEVRAKVRIPFTNYLRSSVGLIAGLLKSLQSPLDLNTMSDKDMDDLLSYAFDRYFDTSALFGTPDTCREMIEHLKEIDVDEIACLIDFGVEEDAVLESLRHLSELKDRSNSREEVRDYSIAAQARTHAPSILQCTPSLLSLLSLDDGLMESLKPLHKLLVGGEALPATLAARTIERLPARLVNMYGPTETTIWSSTCDLLDDGQGVSIGRPIANTLMYVLDDHLQPVPCKSAGELCIGGHGVARGYLDRSGLSADKFVPDPFAGQPGARMYRTGDLVRYSPDGRIEYLGRLDNQVKLRGFRIELEDIESALVEEQRVEQAAVVARDAAPGDKQLVAYIVPKSGVKVTQADLLSHLRCKLPEFMVPSSFVFLTSLPLTTSGKIDRKSLPAPVSQARGDGREYAPPRGSLERTIAAIWQQVLKLEKVSVKDNFFDIGGHSLLLAQVHIRLRDTINGDLPLLKLLEYPTISSLSAYLSRGQGDNISLRRNLDRARKQTEGIRRTRQNFRTRGEEA
jgi:natural product biosynthesis luciferase-like monooxygenase protein